MIKKNLLFMEKTTRHIDVSWYRERMPRIHRVKLFDALEEIFKKNNIIKSPLIIAVFAELLMVAVGEECDLFDAGEIAFLKNWWRGIFPKMDSSARFSSFPDIRGMDEKDIDALFAEALQKKCMEDLRSVASMEFFIAAKEKVYKMPMFIALGPTTHSVEPHEFCELIYPRGVKFVRQ